VYCTMVCRRGELEGFRGTPWGFGNGLMYVCAEGPRDFGEETHGPREDYSTSTRTNTHGSDEVPTYSYTMARPDGSDSYTSSPPTGGYYTTVSGYPLEPAPGYYIASDGCRKCI
jgi:hypothetical protein